MEYLAINLKSNMLGRNIAPTSLNNLWKTLNSVNFMINQT